MGQIDNISLRDQPLVHPVASMEGQLETPRFRFFNDELFSTLHNPYFAQNCAIVKFYGEKSVAR